MERFWLKSYPAGIAADIQPDEFSSLVDFFNRQCERYTHLKCFSNMGHSLTYTTLHQRATAFAAFLQKQLQLDKGDRIALMMPNILQYPVALFGSLLAGLTVVNVNPLYTSDELTHQLNDSGAKAIVVMAHFASVVEQAQSKLRSLSHIIVTEVGDEFPLFYRTLVNFVVRYIKKYPKFRLPSAIQWRDALRQGQQSSLSPVSIHGDDLAFLQYTGGTTGISKGAMLTHRNMVANVMQVTAWIRPCVEEGKELLITALPLYHIFSLTTNCLTYFLLGSENVLITNPREVKSLCATLKKYRFTAITGVNTLYNALLNRPEFCQLDFSHLKIAVAGGMALQKHVAEKWARVTGKPLIQGYGLTEASPVVCVNPITIDRYSDYIGLPVSSTEISIRDDEGHELPFDQIGELCVRGPQVMNGYWQHPEETANIFWPERWLRTGDLAYLTSDGYVKIVDRKKDMIIVSGFNVYPNEIEDVIAAHPWVHEVAVVGGVDPKSGEIVKAFVVASNEELTSEHIVEYCRTKLTNYKIPKKIIFLDSLPKTNVGKVLRRALRDLD